MNQYETSLFETSHACQKQHEDAAEKTELTAAETAHLHPCCKRALALKKAQACADKQGNCTQKTVKFVKADLKFLEFKQTPLPKIAFIAVVPMPFFSVFSPKTLPNYPPITQIADDAPPQYAGRALLNFIQVYRI
jgi:hypothetical protein